MFQYFSTVFYVHFRNSREWKSTSGVGNPCAPHPLNKLLHSLAGSFSEDAKHPFANTTTSLSSIALALYGVMWAYDGW